MTENASNVEAGAKASLTIAEIAQSAIKSIAYIEAYEDYDLIFSSQGSGFVISSEGLIVTNYHVIENAVSVNVEIEDRLFTDHEVALVAVEKEWDLALLKVDVRDLPSLKLGKGTDHVGLGEAVIAMGNPQGMKGTVSDGIVSAVGRDMGMAIELIQTTAPISKGSSGGPLLNMYGDVIGVNTMMLTTGQNLNFAVPVDHIYQLMKREPLNIQVGEFYDSTGYVGGSNRYGWSPGDFAVVLSWEGEIDLDLQIWDENLDYLGEAFAIGSSKDIFDGQQGNEWISFGDNSIPSGKYIIGVYNNEWEFDKTVIARLEVYYPDGKRETYSQSVYTEPPYDQWFGIQINTESKEVKELNFFNDADVVALLEWDTEVDLDITVYDQYYEEFFTVHEVDGMDAINGRKEIEVFLFGDYSQSTGYDHSNGNMNIIVAAYDQVSTPTNAKIRVIHREGSVLRFRHTFTNDPNGEYMWWVAEDFDPSLMTYHEPEEKRVYY